VQEPGVVPIQLLVQRRSRQPLRDEQGFTLIELLVVLLIVGILSAIAIPAFLSQTSKPDDAAAKTQVGTLQRTMEAYADEHEGSYTGATLAEVQKIEPTLKDTTTAVAEKVKGVSATGFEVESEAVGSEDTYKLKYENGTITRSCKVTTESSPGGCKLTKSKGTKGTW
jgi:type IV pilus assembly protein PilA